MQKAMYGMMRALLLFYLKLVDELIADGFELNPYDPCVANKMVDAATRIKNNALIKSDSNIDFRSSRSASIKLVTEGNMAFFCCASAI